MDYAMDAHTGCYKLIRTLKDYEEAINASSFIGSCWCFDAPTRIETNELFSIIGEIKRGYYGEEGLQNIDFVLKIPKIPKSMLSLVVKDFKSHPDVERILQIRWDVLSKEYVIVKPSEFKASKNTIEYSFKDVPRHLRPVLEIHSHNTMQAYFSKTDDADELLKGFYGVVGTVDTEPTYKFRVGMEGYFTEIPMERLFEEV